MGAVRALIALCLVGVACAGTPTARDGNGDPVASVAQWPSALQRVVDEALPTGWMARGDDLWQVFICDIPVATTVTLFDSSATRLTLDPVVVAHTLNRSVATYFSEISHQLYRPSFVAGEHVQVQATDDQNACIDRALALSDSTARGVMIVADAEHAADQPGGFANPGTGCTQPCAAAASRRYAYVGAADFNPSWGSRQPMDLVEHEIGHAIGWHHSGYVQGSSDPHRSSLDVMSNSAAAQQRIASRRDAPDTLAIHRLQVGWLEQSDVVVIGPRGGQARLWPSTAARSAPGPVALIVPIDSDRFLTIELLVATGYNDHLPADGIAIHRVDIGAGVDAMTVTPVHSNEPFDRLLAVGGSMLIDHWRVVVDPDWVVRVEVAR